MLGQRSGRIILGNPEAGNVTVIRLLQQPKGGAGYCDSLDILLQWNSAPFTAGDAIPLSIQIKGASLVIRAFLSRFEIPRPRPSSIPQNDEDLSYPKPEIEMSQIKLSTMSKSSRLCLKIHVFATVLVFSNRIFAKTYWNIKPQVWQRAYEPF